MIGKKVNILIVTRGDGIFWWTIAVCEPKYILSLQAFPGQSSHQNKNNYILHKKNEDYLLQLLQ